VEYKPTSSAQPEIALSKPVHSTVHAKKLVIVSAGALGSPQILERSGVGNPDVLKKLDIPVVVDLPGVGENYQDHHLLLYPYKTSLDEGETLDGILSGRKDFVKALEGKDPMLGWNGIDICAKLRPSATEISSLGPAFQKSWDTTFAPHPTKPLILCGVVNAFLADPGLVPEGQYITMGTYSAYPFSRGSIHVSDREDVEGGYVFDTGFLGDADEKAGKFDLKTQVWGYKMSREIARRLPYYKGELELGHPKFASGSKAALEIGLGDGEVKDLVYSEEDDAAIEDWIRGNLNTTWHSLGTAKMAKREEGGVVDKDLNVYGTTGLKVVDLSVVPENVGANTNNTALVVGEKAAVIIGRELGVEV